MSNRQIVELRTGPTVVSVGQLSLFPRTVADVVDASGIDLVHVQRLRDRGLLSFEPTEAYGLRSREEITCHFGSRGSCHAA